MDSTPGFFATPAMTALFSADAHVERMLRFEAALARAGTRAGLIPPAAAEAIAAACRMELFDVGEISREAALAGTPAIPLVRMLGERVGERGRDYVHFGATSQDAIDTALVLQMREGLNLLLADLLGLGAACASLAEEHRRTPMAGRTLLQQAVPITFGLKAARWLDLTTRQIARLHDVRERALVLQFGGAAGTLAALGAHGPRVAELLGEELGLAVPNVPWHAERDRIGEVAAALGVLAGGMAKIATDVVLLRQTEVGEVSEAPVAGKGGSSAMPQKQNPVDAAFALAAARLAIGSVSVVFGAMAQEHERAAGGWQAEWEAIPNLFRATAGAVARTRAAVEGIEVDPERMQANLDLAGGAVMAEALAVALAAHVGKLEARRMVAAVLERGRGEGAGLREAVLADEDIRAVLPEADLRRVLDPMEYLGSSEHFIDRALAAFRDLDAPVTNADSQESTP